MVLGEGQWAVCLEPRGPVGFWWRGRGLSGGRARNEAFLACAVSLLSTGWALLASGYGGHWECLVWKPSWGALPAYISSAWVAPGCSKGLDPSLLLEAPAVHPGGRGGDDESASFFENKSS